MTRPVRVKDEEWKEKTQTGNSEDSEGEDVCVDKSTYDYKFKICLLGESGVGKTSLIQRYINNIFSDDDDDTNDDNKSGNELNFNRVKSTIGVDCLSTVKIMRGHKICIEVWDTAGQERYNAITSGYLRSANAIIIVYDITDRASFDEVQNKWLNFIKTNINSNTYGGLDVRIAIVANKLDLNDDRVVPKKHGVKLALVNNLRFFEASAKTGRNVNELFRSVCDSICDYWCDLRGNPNFFPADADRKNRIKLDKTKKENNNKSNCVRC